MFEEPDTITLTGNVTSFAKGATRNIRPRVLSKSRMQECIKSLQGVNQDTRDIMSSYNRRGERIFEEDELGLLGQAVSGRGEKRGHVGRRSALLGGLKGRGSFGIPRNCFRGLASRIVGGLPRGRGMALGRRPIDA